MIKKSIKGNCNWQRTNKSSLSHSDRLDFCHTPHIPAQATSSEVLTQRNDHFQSIKFDAVMIFIFDTPISRAMEQKIQMFSVLYSTMQYIVIHTDVLSPVQHNAVHCDIKSYIILSQIKLSTTSTMFARYTLYNISVCTHVQENLHYSCWPGSVQVRFVKPVFRQLW